MNSTRKNLVKVLVGTVVFGLFVAGVASTQARAQATGTLHVITKVSNLYGGPLTAADFTMHVTDKAVEVTSSPTAGAASPGTTFTLEAGQYLVDQDPVEGYRGVWSGPNGANGLVNIAEGRDVTVTRYIYDIEGAFPAGTTTTTTPVQTTTGGTLPDTSTPWYNYLALGASFMLFSALGLGLMRKKTFLS